MPSRILILATVVSCLVFGQAHAQKDLSPQPIREPQSDLFEVSVGFNYIHLDDQFPETKHLYGVSASAFVNATSWLAVGGEFMADFGSRSIPTISGRATDVDSQRYIYVFGPRVTVWHNPRFRLFTEALAGGVHAEAKLSSAQFPFISQTASADAFAAAFGGGFDWRLTNHLSWRILQADYVGTDLGSQWQNNFRASTGIVYSFGHR
jgi:outer membrane protein with beta-barrel domain